MQPFFLIRKQARIVYSFIPISYTALTKSSRAGKLNCVTVFAGTAFGICKKCFSKQIILSAIFLFIIQGLSWGQTQTYNSNGTFTVPAGVTSVTVQAWGGGGKGGEGASAGANIVSGGGGGGGGYSMSTIAVNHGTQYKVTVGQGGNTISPNGTNSVITQGETPILTTNGGTGGGNASTPKTNGTGGTGGTGITSNGGIGTAGSDGAGGNGGAGGSGGAGGTGSNGTPGNGSPGVVPGGGGGGGRSSGGAGGTGASGQVRITYTCAVYSLTATAATNVCITSGSTSTVSFTSSAVGLPVGTYTVTYNRSLPAATGLTATMTVSTAGIGNFTATGFTDAGSSQITITNLQSSYCTNTISANNRVTILVSSAVPNQPSTITNNTPVCAGSTGIAYSVTNVAHVTYTWSYSGSNVTFTGQGTNSISADYAANAISGTWTVTPSNDCGNGTARTLGVTVNRASTAPTSITGTTAICSGGNSTLTANGGTLGTGGTYQWGTGSTIGSNIISGATGVSYTTPALTSTITYWVRRVDPAPCNITTGGVTATLTVNPSGAVGVSISADPPGAVCMGTNVTYTATPTNGGSTPSFQWKVNGENVGINSNVYSYVPNDDDRVSCILTSNSLCATGSATIPITYFSWDDNTKAITDSDIGLDAVSIGGGQYLPGGIGGTTALGPITIPKTDIVLNLGNNSAYNSEGVDYSISYRRAESASQLFSRGSSLIISGGSVFNVSYRVDNGAGSFTTITSSNFNIADDNSFHDYRFTYDPSDGYGRLYINGTEVWTSSATPGKAMYWTGAGDLIIGANTDASGSQIPTFDNLSIKGISLKSAEDEVIQTVNPLPVITIQPLPLTVCEGESGSFTVATSASSPTYQWGYAISPTPASWIDVPEGVDISGTETNVLDIANILLVYNGVYVSCLITANGCETRSSAVLLTVNPLPATGDIIPD